MRYMCRMTDDPLAPRYTIADQARDMAQQGYTDIEVAAELGITDREAGVLMGKVTLPQLRRIEQGTVRRAVGDGNLASHVQAARLLMEAGLPDEYGRQAAQGDMTLRVIVDRSGALRRAAMLESVVEGELVAQEGPPA